MPHAKAIEYRERVFALCRRRRYGLLLSTSQPFVILAWPPRSSMSHLPPPQKEPRIQMRPPGKPPVSPRSRQEARYVRSCFGNHLLPTVSRHRELPGAQEAARRPGGQNNCAAQREPRSQRPGAPGNSPGVSSKKLIMCKICAELCACAVVVTLGGPLLPETTETI